MSLLYLYAVFIILFAQRDEICHGEEDPFRFSTNECSIIEPVYQQKFDFSGLHSDLALQAFGPNGDKFDFNICGNLSRSCDGQNNVAACLKQNNKEYVLGTQHRLHYKKGKIYFEFSGGAKCPNKTENYSFNVLIYCDYTTDKNPTRVITYAEDSCSFYVKLETQLACLPEPDVAKSNKCSVSDSQTGHTFDLLPLSDNNYKTTDRNGSAFVINVCKPVLYGENAMCPPGSSICFLSLNSTDLKNKFFDYGTVQPNPVIENGKLLMRHTSSTKCNSTTNYTSIVYFHCDKNVRNAHPELIVYNDCVYEFLFATPLACNDLAPCTAITRGSGIIDISSLAKVPITLQRDSKNFTIGICTGAGQPCLETDGACFAANDQTTSLGKINSQLRYNHTGSAYLLYENGAECNSSLNMQSTNTNVWSTRIEFICANNTKSLRENGGKAKPVELGPKIVETHNCQLLIHYQTELVCQEQITCKAKFYDEQTEDGTGEGELDLTPLINNVDNYVAQIDDSLISSNKVDKKTKFFLNVCRPLVPKYGLGCPGGSAGCMAIVDGPTPEEEQSLGYPMVSLVAINSSMAELRYLKGSSCPTDKKSELSMGIQFYCDQRAGRGTPILRTISDCHYEFVWASNVICPAHDCNFEANTCDISNPRTGCSYNLKNAHFLDAGQIKFENEKKAFSFNVCGSYLKARTDYSQGLVNLYFTTDEKCQNNGKVNVQMRMICSGETKNATYLTDGIKCNLLYEQRTPDICKFLGLETPVVVSTTSVPVTTTTPTTTTTISPTKPTSTQAGSTSTKEPPSEHHPAEHTGNVGAILAAILSVTCFVSCLAVFALSPQRRNAVRRLFRRSSSAVRYSRVQSNEEANLLLEPNGEFTDTDDDMLL